MMRGPSIRLLVGTIVVTMIALASVRAVVAQPPGADPLPVVRTPIPDEEIAAAKKKAQQDGWLLTPTKEFDAQLARARGHLLGAKTAARLIESRYQADFYGHALTAGTAAWRVQAPADRAGLLPCPQWNLAVSDLTWEDDEEANVLFGLLDGSDVGLWTDAPGERSLAFGWSARGAESPQGTQFELRVPPAPIMLLEIRMSAEYQLLLGKNVGMVTGPHANGSSGLMTWRIRATGKTRLDFTIRKISNENAPATILSTLECRQTLTPDRLHADFDFNLEVLHHPVRDLTFSVTSGLKVFDVSCRQTEIKAWTMRENAEGPGVLALTFAEPMQGAALVVRVRAFLPVATTAGDFWVCPEIRVQRATQRAETVRLSFPADNPLQFWEPRDFRLIDTQDDQGTQTLTLVDAFPQGESKRPRFLVKTAGIELTTTQKTRWLVAPTETTATTEINYDLARGQLMQLKLALRLPKVGNWQVASVKLLPGDDALTWGLVESWLIVDLKKAINPRSDATLQVVLKGDWHLGDEIPHVVDFPEVEPLDTLARQGTVAIQVSPLFQASLIPGSMPGFPIDPGKEAGSSFYFGFRNQRHSGQLRLVGLPAEYAARVQQTAILRGEECLVNAEVAIEPLVGQPTFVDVWVQGRGTVRLKPGDGKESAVRSLQRLPQPDVYQALATLSGGMNPFGIAGVHALLPRGQHWRLTLREPLKKAVTIELQCARRVPLALGPWLLCLQPATHPFTLTAGMVQMDAAESQLWVVPIVSVPRAARFAGEVQLQLEDVSIQNVLGWGMDMLELPDPADSSNGAPTSRSFRYGSWSMVDYPRLWVAAQAKKASAQESAAIDHARLASFVDEDGGMHHHLSWTLWNWRSREFVVRLPGPAYRVLGVRLDGRALDHWLLHSDESGQRLQIPLMMEAPRDVPLHRIEVFYAPKEKVRVGPFGGPVAAAMPEFPIPPIQARHTWHLAPGMLPVHQEQMQSLYRAAPGAWLGRSVWQAGSGFTEFFVGEREQPWRTKQADLLKYAERETRRSAVERPWLGHWVQALAFHASLETTPVVLDREALRRRGCTPQGSFEFDPARPFWESLGLTYVPCPDAILLTSPEKAARAETDSAFRRELVESVHGAARAGQDRSGQFTAADYWLRSEAPGGDALDHLPPFLKRAVHAGWTDWEWLPGKPMDALAVANVASVRWLALIAATALFLVGLRLRSVSPRLAMRFALVLLTLAWLACNVSPVSLRELFVWPLFAALLLLGACYAAMQHGHHASTPAEPRPGQSTHKANKAALASLLLLLAAGWMMPSVGQPLAISEVRVAPAQGNQPETALVPPELDAQLKTLAAKTPSGFSSAVFLKSRYKATWHGAYARIRAEFDVHCFQQETKLLVPLVDAELESGTTVDEAKVYPVLAPGPKPTGYILGVQGAGTHRIKLSFLLQSVSNGDFSELRCGIPASPDARLEGLLPPSWMNPQAATCLGADTIQKNDKGTHWDMQAELGAESTLKIRWRSDIPSGKAQIEVRESYLVDLRPGSANVSAFLQYKAVKGVAEHLQIAVHDLEVRKVEWSLDGKVFAPLGSWSMEPRGESRVLHLELPEPTSGPFQILLEMAPRWSAPGKLEVRLPLPSANLRGGYFAYRSEGLETTLSTVQLADTRINKVDEFGWPKKLDSLAVYSFGRKAAQAALRFDMQTPVPQVSLATQWTMQPPYVNMRADMTWSSTDPFSLVQIEVPQGVTLTDVQGQKAQEVHHWSRTKNILQVWLQKPAKQVSLSAIGWLNVPPLKENRFLLQPLVPLQTRVLSASVAVRTTAPYELLPLARKDKAVRISDESATQRAYELTTPRVPVEFGFVRRATAPTWQALTRVETQDGLAAWRTSLTLHHPFGLFGGVKLVLRDWPYRVQTHWNEPLTVRSYERKGADHVWVLDSKPGVGPSQVALNLQGRWPRKLAGPLSVPSLELQNAERVLHTLHLEGCELTTSSRAFVAETKQTPQNDADVMTLADPKARIAVRPLARPRLVPIEVLYAEQTTFYSPADSWRHRSDWLFHTKANPELSVRLPRGAHLSRLSVNDQPATPVLASEARLTVPLPPESLCRVTLEWRYDAGAQPLTRPNLASPVLDGLDAPMVHHALLLPAGLELDRKDGAGDMSVLLFAQARAYLAPDSGASLKVRKLGERAARHARYRALLANKKVEEIDKLLAEQKIVAAPLAVDAPASRSELTMIKAPLPTLHDVHAGQLFLWTHASKEDAPVVELHAIEYPLPFIARGPREVVTLFLLAILLVSLLPGGLRWLTALWPEQLAFAVLVGVAMGGFTPLAAAGLLAALLARLVLCVRWMHRLLARWWRRKDEDNSLSSVHFQGPG